MQPRSTPIRQNRLANLLIETSPVSIVLTDPLGTVGMVNHVTEDWFGYLESELVGKKMETLFSPESMSADASRSMCFLSQLRDPDSSKRLDLIGQRKDGSKFPVRVTLHTLVTVAGDMILTNILANVTGSYESDSCHRKRIAGERLAAILEMISGLAHESRNALQRAQACLDLLELDLADNSELLNLTGRIRTSLTDLRDNYEEVKDYATPIVLKRAEVSFAQLCQATFDTIASEHSHHSPSLRIECEPACELVSVDPPRMTRVLANLFENAIQANPPGGKVVVAWRQLQKPPGGSIEVTIRDHGSGLTIETADRMFEPFFTTKQQGTGLGLAVCRRIIDAHGGTIEAVNHPNGGVVVRIVLPA